MTLPAGEMCLEKLPPEKLRGVPQNSQVPRQSSERKTALPSILTSPLCPTASRGGQRMQGTHTTLEREKLWYFLKASFVEKREMLQIKTESKRLKRNKMHTLSCLIYLR